MRARQNGRLGLLGMRERIEMLGGTLTIESTLGRGNDFVCGGALCPSEYYSLTIHGILRAGLRNLLNAEPGMEVIGEATDGIQVLEMVEQSVPDLILLDISMPNMGGIEVLEHLREKKVSSKVLMMTVHEDESLLKKAIRAGASGYLVKRAAVSELINAIKIVMQGDLYIHPSMNRALFKDLVPPPFFISFRHPTHDFVKLGNYITARVLFSVIPIPKNNQQGDAP